jgi:hypothetical protein
VKLSCRSPKPSTGPARSVIVTRVGGPSAGNSPSSFGAARAAEAEAIGTSWNWSEYKATDPSLKPSAAS